MKKETLLRDLSQKNDRKMLMIVLDGLGGLPRNGKTELETAATPHLDKLTEVSECGLSHPVARGITPGSGPAHLALFGYEATEHIIGRGILEALGIGVKVGEQDVVFRGNFATSRDGVVTDRRAGRILTEKNREITALLQKQIPRIEDTSLEIFPGKEHRFVLKISGADLSDGISDADPLISGKPIPECRATEPGAEKTARVVNLFIRQAAEALSGQKTANSCLLRGGSKYPRIPNLKDRFLLTPAAVAVYPMYRGLAELVGMTTLDTGPDLADQIHTLRSNIHRFDFFFMHIKKTDSHGEDGNFDKKTAEIEQFDRHLPDILALGFDVIAITGDHSTPALLGTHSWHPNPILLHSPHSRLNARTEPGFSEKQCALGALGQFPATDIMPLMMAHALKLKKYGA